MDLKISLFFWYFFHSLGYGVFSRDFESNWLVFEIIFVMILKFEHLWEQVLGFL